MIESHTYRKSYLIRLLCETKKSNKIKKRKQPRTIFLQMAYLRFHSHIFNFYRYNKNVTRCHLTRYFHIQRTMYCKYLSFLVHFLVVYLLFKKCLFHQLYYTKSFHIFQQIVQYLMHYLYPYCEIHPSNLIYRCRISHFRIISCFFQGFNDLIFMFCTECFHCDRKFYRTISVDTYELVML